MICKWRSCQGTRQIVFLALLHVQCQSMHVRVLVMRRATLRLVLVHIACPSRPDASLALYIVAPPASPQCAHEHCLRNSKPSQMELKTESNTETNMQQLRYSNAQMHAYSHCGPRGTLYCQQSCECCLRFTIPICETGISSDSFQLNISAVHQGFPPCTQGSRSFAAL